MTADIASPAIATRTAETVLDRRRGPIERVPLNSSIPDRLQRMEAVDLFAPILRSDLRSSTELAEDNVPRTVTVAVTCTAIQWCRSVSYKLVPKCPDSSAPAPVPNCPDTSALKFSAKMSWCQSVLEPKCPESACMLFSVQTDY